MIQSIAFFAYPVTDMVRARRFYEELLLLKLETNFHDQWIEYDIGGGTFAITSADINHQPGAPGGLVAFEVDDLDAEVQRLKALHVLFVRDIMATPVCRMAVIADPDGNHITLHKRNA
jgi:predicted enzyme related to lactoylglutathione lyase